MNLFLTGLAAVFVMLSLSVLYHVLPARKRSKNRPYLSIFPKYVLSISNMDMFYQNLDVLKFGKASDDKFTRGHPLGDFSLKWAQLSVKIDPIGKTATLGSGSFLIAFDTGDLWDISESLLGET